MRAAHEQGILGQGGAGARRAAGGASPPPPRSSTASRSLAARPGRVDPVALDVDRRFAVLLQVAGDRGDERVAERDLALRVVGPPGRPQDAPEEPGDVVSEVPVGLVGRHLAGVLPPFQPGEDACHPIGQEAFVQARRESLAGTIVTRHQTAR